jgi:hypothetical protein
MRRNANIARYERQLAAARADKEGARGRIVVRRSRRFGAHDSDRLEEFLTGFALPNFAKDLTLASETEELGKKEGEC